MSKIFLTLISVLGFSASIGGSYASTMAQCVPAATVQSDIVQSGPNGVNMENALKGNGFKTASETFTTNLQQAMKYPISVLAPNHLNNVINEAQNSVVLDPSSIEILGSRVCIYEIGLPGGYFGGGVYFVLED